MEFEEADSLGGTLFMLAMIPALLLLVVVIASFVRDPIGPLMVRIGGGFGVVQLLWSAFIISKQGHLSHPPIRNLHLLGLAFVVAVNVYLNT